MAPSRLRSVRCLILLLTAGTLFSVAFWWRRILTRWQLMEDSELQAVATAMLQIRADHGTANQLDANSVPTVCDNSNCSELLLKLADGQKRIPTTRHILWKSESVPKYFANQLKTWYDLMPNWSFVLWTDADLDKFVQKFYPQLFAKYRSLSKYIMKLDLVRYMLVHQFGGVYADVDYILVKSLDSFTAYPGVFTAETEAHAILAFGMRQWPLKKLMSPALFMAPAGHGFLDFCLHEFSTRQAKNYFTFAGPEGLTDIFYTYSRLYQRSANWSQLLYVPPSYSFYPYDNNSLATSTSSYQSSVRSRLKTRCRENGRAKSSALDNYCKNFLNLDPITDSSATIFAVHDNKKPVSTYDPAYREKQPVPVVSVIPNLLFGRSWL